MKIIAISFDQIVYEIALLVTYFFTVSTLAERNIFLAAEYKADYDIWTACILSHYYPDSHGSPSSYDREYEDNRWESTCGALPAIHQRNLRRLKMAAVFSCSPALLMAASHILARWFRFYFNRRENVSVRDRWAIPESIRLFGMRTTLPAPMKTDNAAAFAVAVAPESRLRPASRPPQLLPHQYQNQNQLQPQPQFTQSTGMFQNQIPRFSRIRLRDCVPENPPPLDGRQVEQGARDR
jgi:hypothetical protein